ncbi:MAG: beta-ketoacyl-ACP synthase II [Alcaligenaceae bacterium]|nr:beta-ketoacyl-ACP synthase II [Alcaligenaceae bacterium]
MKRRVVVTGLGAISPLGTDVNTNWSQVLSGHSGIDFIDRFDTQNCSVKIAGQVPHFDPDIYFNKKDLKMMDLCIQYGVAAGLDAWRDAGLNGFDDLDVSRCGVIVSSGMGGLPRLETVYHDIQTKGYHRISPFVLPASLLNLTSGQLSIRLGLTGPNYALVSACASSAHSMGDAMRMIQYGDVDVMLAGGSEGCISPVGVGTFAAMRALSTNTDNPQQASRPWDKDRNGFILSEGAGVLVLESYEHATARGAHIYAELVGYGASSDAHHITVPHESGAALAMNKALADAKISPTQVNYINAHGTSTPLGDLNETKAIHLAFGDHAKQLCVSSTKSMTGHLLGAAGGLEAVFSVLSLRDQVAPPTINLDAADEGCDLDYCAHQARDISTRYVLSNSFGFGGTNVSLIFHR